MHKSTDECQIDKHRSHKLVLTLHFFWPVTMFTPPCLFRECFEIFALKSWSRRPAVHTVIFVHVSIPVCSAPSSSLLTWRLLRFQRAVDRKIFLTMVWSLENLINGGMELERLTYTLKLPVFICTCRGFMCRALWFPWCRKHGRNRGIHS